MLPETLRELHANEGGPMPTPNTTLEIDRKDHSRTRITEEPLADLAPGQVRFRVDRFALTANNVTYAVVGDALDYWGFFPAESGWGRVPAMGWGDVVESSHPEVTTGGRYFGWYPMAQHVDMTVTPSREGLRDDGAHRAPHAPVYRAYTASDRDPFHQPGEDAEDRQALLRGLFLTAFLADDFFGEAEYFGASRVVVLSASSKTAIGFAQRASQRRLAEVVGLTSPGNLAFVSGLGCYDRVLAYDDLESLAPDADSVSIDMAGDGALLERVHRHLGDRLRYSMAVGLSHHGAAPAPEGMPGPAPQFFFAPAQVSKRTQDWGPEGYQQRVAAALREFVDTSGRWLTLSRSHGSDAAVAAWGAAYDGKVPPSVGTIVSLWDR
jgi:hypothetical protein